MTDYAYNFIFEDANIANGANIIVIDESNPVIQAYSGYPALSADTFFYEEMNRVLGNLHTIRWAQPNIGTLVSFVNDSASVKYQVTLV